MPRNSIGEAMPKNKIHTLYLNADLYHNDELFDECSNLFRIDVTLEHGHPIVHEFYLVLGDQEFKIGRNKNSDPWNDIFDWPEKILKNFMAANPNYFDKENGNCDQYQFEKENQ